MITDESMRHLQESHGPALLRFATRLTHGDAYRAEDVVQETLLRAWRHPEERDEDGHWTLPWLFTVARRIVIDQARAAQRRPAERLDERVSARPEVATDDEIGRLIDRHEVLAALRTLTDRQRAVLVELYLLDHTTAEAAVALGVRSGTVRSRAHYALRTLRHRLRSRGFVAA